MRHIRVISTEEGFCINKADAPCATIEDLVKEKQGEKIKSKLHGEGTKETVLLKEPLPYPEDEGQVAFDGTGLVKI